MVDEIEAVERAALEDLTAAAAGDLVGELGAASGPIGSAFVATFGALPESSVVANRVIGLGLSAPATEEELDRIVERYATAGVGRYFVHLHPDAAPAEIEAWLGDRGLAPARAWMKFRRGREMPPAVATDLEIRPAGPGDAAAFGRIEADAFDVGTIAAPWLARLVGRPDWHIYMSFADGEPAGAGALFVRDGVGWLDWGATAPAFRGRRGQSALLRRRIVDALDLGCRLLATETGEEVPGEPQISYHNILKMGFAPAYARANFALPKRRG